MEYKDPHYPPTQTERINDMLSTLPHMKKEERFKLLYDEKEKVRRAFRFGNVERFVSLKEIVEALEDWIRKNHDFAEFYDYAYAVESSAKMEEWKNPQPSMGNQKKETVMAMSVGTKVEMAGLNGEVKAFDEGTPDIPMVVEFVNGLTMHFTMDGRATKSGGILVKRVCAYQSDSR